MTTTTIAAVVDIDTGSMPSFMSLSNVGVLTVDSASNSNAKTYNMKITMTTANSGNQLFSTLTVVVNNCVITHPTAPTEPASKTYSIFAPAALANDLVSPGFL